MRITVERSFNIEEIRQVLAQHMLFDAKISNMSLVNSAEISVFTESKEIEEDIQITILIEQE